VLVRANGDPAPARQARFESLTNSALGWSLRYVEAAALFTRRGTLDFDSPSMFLDKGRRSRFRMLGVSLRAGTEDTSERDVCTE